MNTSAYFTGLVVLKHLCQTRCSHDHVWKQRIIVADCNIVLLQQLNSQKRKTLGMPMYLLCNGKRSAIKPFTPPRQVAVSGSGVLARPTSSLQQMVPAGNNLQKVTALKHPAGMSSWMYSRG